MYEVIKNVPEANGMYYVSLRHTGMVWSTSHDGDVWVRMERSGRFWIVVQRKEKWKKVNKVRHLTKRGHNRSSCPIMPLGWLHLHCLPD